MRRLACLFLAANFVAHAALAQAGSASSTFQAMYAKMKTAMAERNGSAISALLAPDFVSEDVEGKTGTRDQMLADLAKVRPDPARKSETTVISASVQGAVATVVQRYRSSSSKPAADGQARVTDIDTQSNDTWRLDNGTWRLSKTVTERLEYRVNGVVLAQQIHSPG